MVTRNLHNKGKRDHSHDGQGSKHKKQAFIFTTDAFLALPLIVISISSFIAFTVTLQENTVLHEYAYTVSRDALSYLSEVSATTAGVNTSGYSVNSVMDLLVILSINGDKTMADNVTATALDKYIPSSVGYVLEYYNSSSSTWVTIRQAGNALKFQRPKIQVSNVKVVTALSEPVELIHGSCASAIVCSMAPVPFYSSTTLYEPLVMRIRVFA